MGVPGFVAWLYANHKKSNFIFKQLFKSTHYNLNDNFSINFNDDINIDFDENYFDENYRVNSVEHLLIDANCAIHPQARDICVANPNLAESNLDLLEKKIIKQVITYIELLIFETKPTKSIYIAVDGVAPMAKIKHQRLRRFKAVHDRKKLEYLAKKYNKPINKEWNSSAITPGTIFMDKLMKALLIWTNNFKYDGEIVFSSSYTPGEGEHKLLQYLKNIELTSTDVTVIYGLDADLLFLALSSGKHNLYLMRETSQMEIEKSKSRNQSNQSNLTNSDDFSYLSIEILSEIIIQEMLQRLSSDRMWDRSKLINDFIFLCYFCGNDFLPHIPSLSIKPPNRKIKNGIEIVVNTYTDSMLDINSNSLIPTKYLIQIKSSNKQKITICKELFLNILEALANSEAEYFNDMFKYKRRIMNTIATDPYEIEKYNFEENIIENYYDPIKLGDPRLSLNQMKISYYKHYFNVNVCPSDFTDKSLNIIMEQYVQGLVWTLYYYYDKCKDYEWFYEHHHGPFISDLYNYIKSNIDSLSFYEQLYAINGIWFENQIKPLQQLMMVLPHESSYLVPSSYRNLMFGHKLKDYFPLDTGKMKMDYLYKNRSWQNIPMIKILSPCLVLNLTSKIILKEENERNYIYEDFVKKSVNESNNLIKII